MDGWVLCVGSGAGGPELSAAQINPPELISDLKQRQNKWADCLDAGRRRRRRVKVVDANISRWWADVIKV